MKWIHTHKIKDGKGNPYYIYWVAELNPLTYQRRLFLGTTQKLNIKVWFTLQKQSIVKWLLKEKWTYADSSFRNLDLTD